MVKGFSKLFYTMEIIEMIRILLDYLKKNTIIMTHLFEFTQSNNLIPTLQVNYKTKRLYANGKKHHSDKVGCQHNGKERRI